MHTAQSMHSSGSMTRKLGPSLKQSTGQTSTQSVCLHLMQLSVTTWVIGRFQRENRRPGLPGRPEFVQNLLHCGARRARLWRAPRAPKRCRSLADSTGHFNLMPSRKTLMPLKNNAVSTPARRGATKPRGRRDPDGTRARILEAALHEFATNGYAGARVDRISKRAKTFDRMLYYHFGNKEDLFRLVLERIYEDLWAAEERLELADADPVEGIRALIAFTWNYYYEHPEFVRLLNSENLQRGRNLRKSARVGKLSSPFIRILEDLLRRGTRAGVFRGGVDPVQLYITIASLGYFYLSNRYTLSRFLDLDLVAPGRRAAWLEHITGMVLDHLRPRGRGD